MSLLEPVAAAFVAAVTAEGLDPDPGLALVAAAPRTLRLDAPTVSCPADLGVLYERGLRPADRTARGVWFTPPALCADLVARAIPEPTGFHGPVVDPACGGGAFLLAAADRLAEAGWSPAAVIDALVGYDIDPGAISVCEAALWWWAARRGAPRLPGGVSVADGLLGCLGPAGAVVGNPPFLGQLRSATARDQDRQRVLQDRYGDAVRAYTDVAALFLLAAVDALRDGGRVAMVQPRSVLASRDGAAVRAAIDDVAQLESVWIDDGNTFDAAVEAVAPVFVRSGEAANDWTGPLADRHGIPRVALPGSDHLGQRARVAAGFRDEYYGLVDAVTEGGHGPRLVTVGAIEPFRFSPPERGQRFAKRRWRDPSVDPSRLSGRARSWVEFQDGPKLLVATQTRVVEAVADPTGSLVGSTPAIAVRVDVADEVWPLLAALHAPVVSAWMLRRTAGSGLSAQACRPRSADIAALPLPTDSVAWSEATVLARSLHEGTGERIRFARVANAAYGCCDDAVANWWLQRW